MVDKMVMKDNQRKAMFAKMKRGSRTSVSPQIIKNKGVVQFSAIGIKSLKNREISQFSAIGIKGKKKK